MKTGEFVKTRRKALRLSQPELAKRAGVGLRLVRDIEQGKRSLQMAKVNLVLSLFNHELGPVKTEPESRHE